MADQIFEQMMTMGRVAQVDEDIGDFTEDQLNAVENLTKQLFLYDVELKKEVEDKTDQRAKEYAREIAAILVVNFEPNDKLDDDDEEQKEYLGQKFAELKHIMKGRIGFMQNIIMTLIMSHAADAYPPPKNYKVGHSLDSDMTGLFAGLTQMLGNQGINMPDLQIKFDEKEEEKEEKNEKEEKDEKEEEKEE